MTVKQSIQSISGFIQAGGKSQRMGQNKALLKLAGYKLIEYSIKSLTPIVSQLGIITSTPEVYSDLNIASYPDIWPGLGPLAGIYAALEYSENDYVLSLACDMPFIPSDLLKLLVKYGENHQVCVPLDFQGQIQPLCALYHKSCQPNILTLINQAKYAPRGLFSLVKTQIVSFECFAHLSGAKHFFENINSPEDFSLAHNYLKLE
ncbi:MAG: molybdopterin-guanine dinucleotide biosynthesis protein A [bacterium]|nr:MAG: molybdopterin-guanine dinucleotide biosynthesis protein A [bacterium]